MKKARIYVDTSVIGGCFDPEFRSWSNGLIEDFRADHFRLVVSEVTAAEIERAPIQVRDLYKELVTFAEVLSLSEEVLALLEKYEANGVLDSRFRNDMLHIALATVADVDVLVSWNFRHVVRLDKIQQFNGINVERGYKPLAIYSPREVATYERRD
jgi:predicted nucleic acid-binding protein